MEMRVDGKAVAGIAKGNEFLVVDGGNDFRRQWLKAGQYRYVEMHSNGQATVDRLGDYILEERLPTEALIAEPDQAPPIIWVTPRVAHEVQRCRKLSESIERMVNYDGDRSSDQRYEGWHAVATWAEELLERARRLSSE